MKMHGQAVRVAIAGCVTLGVGGWLGLAAQEDGSAAAVRIAREWRQTHERQIVEDMSPSCACPMSLVMQRTSDVTRISCST
jgi:hypothetical protein